MLRELEAVDLREAWLVAGRQFQTVWSRHSGQPVAARIKACDACQSDTSDLFEAVEAAAYPQRWPWLTIQP